MRIFNKSKKDAILVAYAGVAFFFPFVVGNFIDSIWLWLLLAPFQIVFLVIVMNTSMHHNMHVPYFKPKWLNRAYELFVSAAVGIPHQGWAFFHSIHHKYNNDFSIDGKTYDPVSFYRYGENGERENFWKYCFKGVWRDLTGYTFADPHDNCHTKVKIHSVRKLREENLAFILWMFAIYLVNWQYGLFYTAVYLLSLAANHANSYGEHFGPVEQGNFRANSVGSYGKLYNFLCFNSGYHQEHHVRPSAHWTELPNITPTLPEKRHKIKTMYIFNAPCYNDFIELFKGKLVK
jgi:fatty acid desaturase